MSEPVQPFLVAYDLYYLWCGGSIVRSGGNPYDVEQLSQCLLNIGWPVDEGIQPLTHPASNFVLYYLLSLLPFQSARILWPLFTWATSIWLCTLWLWRHAENSTRPSYRFAALLFLGVLPPFVSDTLWGQVNVVHFAGITFFYLFFRSRKDFIAGLVLVLSLFKPQLYLAFYAYLGVIILQEKRWRILGGGLLGSAIYLGSVPLYFRGGWTYYLQRFSTLNVDIATIPGATLTQQCSALVGGSPLCLLIPLVGILTGVFIARSSIDQVRGVSLTLCVSLIFSPYGWSHSLGAAFPAYRQIIGNMVERWAGSRGFLLITVLLYCVSLILALNPHTQAIWLLIPAAGIPIALSKGIGSVGRRRTTDPFSTTPE